MTKVLIVDDDPLVRSALSLMLGGQSDIDVVGEASDGRDGVRLARQTRTGEPRTVRPGQREWPTDAAELERLALHGRAGRGPKHQEGEGQESEPDQKPQDDPNAAHV